jgi:hypothetical protein
MISKPMRIVSDGTPFGTKVYDADGAEIKGCITKVEWSIEVDGIGQAKLTFSNVEVDVIGDAGE